MSRLADTYDRLGDTATATSTRRTALAVYEDLGHPDADRLRRQIGPVP